MTEETDGTIAGTEGVDAPSQVDTAAQPLADDTAAQDTGTDEPGQADEPGDPPKRKPWWEKRFDELTAKKYDAEREAAYWRGIAEASRGSGQSQQQQTPIPDRWEDPEGYDRYLIQQAVSLAKEQTAQELRQQQTFRTYEERENAVRQAKPDYDSVVRDPSLPITPLMAEVIRESDKGPDVAYWLGTNRSEAQRIAGLAPHLQAAALGRIEAGFIAPARAQPRTPPPAPPQTVAGISSGINKSPDDMSMAEYVAWMKERDKT